jgi:hypothetical protein
LTTNAHVERIEDSTLERALRELVLRYGLRSLRMGPGDGAGLRAPRRPRPRMARLGDGSTITRRAPECVAPRRQALPNVKLYTDARLKAEH